MVIGDFDFVAKTDSGVDIDCFETGMFLEIPLSVARFDFIIKIFSGPPISSLSLNQLL